MKDKKRSKAKIPAPSQKELEDKAKYEEFWSDPCWTEPIHATESTTA